MTLIASIRKSNEIYKIDSRWHKYLGDQTLDETLFPSSSSSIIIAVFALKRKIAEENSNLEYERNNPDDLINILRNSKNCH
jgi:hypothetical protein